MIVPLYDQTAVCRTARTVVWEGLILWISLYPITYLIILEHDFEDVVRTAVSLGGDCDTLTDIAAAMAEAMYGVPEELQREVQNRIPSEMQIVLEQFEKTKLSRVPVDA